MKKRNAVWMVIVLLLASGLILAQEDDGGTLALEVVMVGADDGLSLQGDYYPLLAETEPEEAYPAVLLLHMLGRDRTTWQPLIRPLHEAGFVTLAVDMRGHGATGGERDWEKAEDDIQTWLDWLKSQPNVGAVFIVGASVGGNLALIGCANDPECGTVVALSPGLDFRGVMPETAVVEGLLDRAALLVAAHGDTYSADSVRQMATNSRGEIGLRIYRDGAHGTNMFTADYQDRVITLIVNWLVEHLP
jgi:pimeloyl-ACP methyl ester carboxylesterase